MGRSASSQGASSLTGGITVSAGASYFAEASLNKYALGGFGGGFTRTFIASGSFTVPAGVTKLRVTCVGAGGGGAANTVAGSAGGTTSFGAYLSATGGAGGAVVSGGTASGGAGGTGVGGDINATGGKGGNHVSGAQSGAGGGGVATPLGNGGDGADCGIELDGPKAIYSNYSTGGASGNGTNYSAAAAQLVAFPAQIPGIINRMMIGDYLTATRTGRKDGRSGPFALIGGDGGGGDSSYEGAGGGGGGYISGGFSGYGIDNSGSLQCRGGDGGFGGGGGGGAGYTTRGAAGGGGGIAVKVIDVTPGQVITVTVGLGGAGASNTNSGGKGGDGCVIVEF